MEKNLNTVELLTEYTKLVIKFGANSHPANYFKLKHEEQLLSTAIKVEDVATIARNIRDWQPWIKKT